jgi:hypothetical protein
MSCASSDHAPSQRRERFQRLLLAGPYQVTGNRTGGHSVALHIRVLRDYQQRNVAEGCKPSCLLGGFLEIQIRFRLRSHSPVDTSKHHTDRRGAEAGLTELLDNDPLALPSGPHFWLLAQHESFSTSILVLIGCRANQGVHRFAEANSNRSARHHDFSGELSCVFADIETACENDQPRPSAVERQPD